jgi:hypothetical protein
VSDLFLEHFTGAVVGARDGQRDRLVGERGVDLGPGGVGVVDQLAVDRDLGGDGLVDTSDRGQGEVWAIGSEVANTMPSKPNWTSRMSVTPLATQSFDARCP